MFDKYEALDLLQSLVHLARNESHKKSDEYAAALDEIRARTDALDHLQLQRLFLGSLGILFVPSCQGSHCYFKGRWQGSSPIPLAMDPLCVDRLLTRHSKALSASDALSGGMLPVHAVITR